MVNGFKGNNGFGVFKGHTSPPTQVLRRNGNASAQNEFVVLTLPTISRKCPNKAPCFCRLVTTGRV